MSDSAQTAWLRSAGHVLPDGETVCLSHFAVAIADVIGMQFRRGVESPLYPGHLIDAAVTLWLAKLDASGGLPGALKVATRDPDDARTAALEWHDAWFRDHGWQMSGPEHWSALEAAQAMWGDIWGATTTPVSEHAGTGGESGDDPLGKPSGQTP